MALINCKLCNNKISTRAEACPKCGCPTIARTGAQTASHQKKNCAECEFGGMDGGYACNLCDTNSASAFQHATAARASGVVTGDRTHNVPAADLDLLVKIDELEIDSSLKDIFIKIATTQAISGLFGIKRYQSECIELKYFRSVNSMMSISSNQALLLGPFYYILYGMWRKGVVFVALQLAAVSGIVFGNQVVQIASAALLLVLQLVMYCSAKQDRYRQLVLDEIFWW